MDEPRRNDVIDRELRRAFAAGGGAAAGPHLDAEVAAAWMERRLDAGSEQAVETHLADCHECQTLLATLARISPEEAPTSADGLGWWRRLRAGWLVPAAVAAAAALVIWVAVPQQRNTSEPTQLANALPAPSPSAAPEASAPSRPAPLPPGAPAVAQREDDSKNAFAPQPSEPQRKAVAEPQAPPLADRALEPPLPAGAVELRERSAAAVPAAPDSASASAKVEAEPPVVNTQRAQRDNRVTVTGESPAPPPPAARQEALAGASARALDSLASRAALARLSALVVVPADNTARWRRAGSAFEFAPRGDAPFTVATLPVAVDTITAGSSPGGTVCWLTGRGGVVLVATDGLRFARLTAPAPVDLVAVTATDARTATVTAADGRRFRTTNQGASWSALP